MKRGGGIVVIGDTFSGLDWGVELMLDSFVCDACLVESYNIL